MRRATIIVAVFVGMLVSGAVDSSRAASTSQGAAVKPPKDIGDTPPLTWRCTRDGGWMRPRCPGYLPAPNNPGRAAALKNMKFQRESTPANPGNQVTIASIEDADRFKFRDLANDEYYVLARITTNPAAQAGDNIYGIGDLGNTFSNHFFIVANGYHAETVGTDSAGRGPRVRISRYSIIGIEIANGQERAVEVGKGGYVHWCVHKHSNKKGQADFIGCRIAEQAAALAENPRAMALLSGQLGKQSVPDLAEYLVGEVGWVLRASSAYIDRTSLAATDPTIDSLIREVGLAFRTMNLAWFTCGVGCCVAEPDA